MSNIEDQKNPKPPTPSPQKSYMILKSNHLGGKATSNQNLESFCLLFQNYQPINICILKQIV